MPGPRERRGARPDGPDVTRRDVASPHLVEAAVPYRRAVPPMRIATFNLLHGLSLRTGRADPDGLRQAAQLLAADVLGVQEVDRDQPRSGGVDQTALVAEGTGAAHWRFLPTVHGTPGESDWQPAHAPGALAALSAPEPSSPGGWASGEDGLSRAYGIGLVSRWPVRQWAALHFPGAPVALPLLVPGPTRPRVHRVPDEPRAALLAVVETPDGPVSVVTTHLSFVPGFNLRQLRTLTRWARGFPAPRLLVGDCNLPGAVPARVSRWRRLAKAPTYPSYRPRAQLDHVLGDGFDGEVGPVHALPLPVSDHCGLVVELRR